MKTVVIYKSRYGYTEKYAKWLSEKLNADLFEAAEIRSLDFSEYDTVIYGWGLYAGGINGLKNLKEIFGEISEKNIVLFVRESNHDENKNVMTYVCLGKVFYKSHYGSQPMSITWELEYEIPPFLWKNIAKMSVG